MEPSLNRNLLHVTLSEFKRATKVFTPKRRALGTALMAFEGGFLSIESGDVAAVMHAEGEWHGRATFSPSVLRALATAPPIIDPIPIAYAEGKILFGGLTIPCQWSVPSQALAQKIENPSLIDMLAMGRTMSRADMRGTDLGRRVRSAVVKADHCIKSAVAQLVDLNISEAEILTLVEARIKARIQSPV